MKRGLTRRLRAAGLAVLAGSWLLALAPAGGAQAAPTRCAGHQVRALPFPAGAVHVFRRHGYVCALTVAAQPGAARPVSVSVQARGSLPVTDSGRRSHRAGPVTVHTGHRCVRIAGSVGTQSVRTGWILC
ncbi:hypothetical protein [Streptomyces thermodiastaticus]|uniref:hypothetical protein n=1 Tax=Streptomyces thermodiastaticus TaxID=44061 RepID=UPI0019C72093|nr:hypothetical protein [Streptomyces thermodiastaticus]MCE7553413.1 hypothetical protein [Streptomyces thermodiastaticus]GHF96807.1 hypothetical protein GCM10018787_51750 [Streptomyces thermodiastaticus]